MNLLDELILMLGIFPISVATFFIVDFIRAFVYKLKNTWSKLVNDMNESSAQGSDGDNTNDELKRLAANAASARYNNNSTTSTTKRRLQPRKKSMKLSSQKRNSMKKDPSMKDDHGEDGDEGKVQVKIKNPLRDNDEGGSSFIKANIREATSGEGVVWREEQASRAQFNGFNIYGQGFPVDASACIECYQPSSSTTTSATPLNNLPHWSFGDGINSTSVIKHLPGSDIALDLLNRLQKDYDPVVKARGWNVLHLNEFCCCTNKRKPPNVAGYCVPAGNSRTAHQICIRLRPHGTCGNANNFYPYKSLVRVMAHELAHIVHSQHSDAFYKLMGEILHEKDIIGFDGGNGGDHFFPLLTSGRRLGTEDIGGPSPLLGSRELRHRVAQAAKKRELRTRVAAKKRQKR